MCIDEANQFQLPFCYFVEPIESFACAHKSEHTSKAKSITRNTTKSTTETKTITMKATPTKQTKKLKRTTPMSTATI